MNTRISLRLSHYGNLDLVRLKLASVINSAKACQTRRALRQLGCAAALRQEVIADWRAAQKEAIPGLPEGRNDALVAYGAYFNLLASPGQADV